MKLLSGETVLVRSNDDKIVLTNLRIYMHDRSWWRKFYETTLFLEDISSIEYIYQSNIFYFILGVFSLLGLITTGGDSLRYKALLYFWLILAGFFFTAWLSGRGYLIRISSRGGRSINFLVDRMEKEQVDDFLDKVQEAKHIRMRSI